MTPMPSATHSPRVASAFAARIATTGLIALGAIAAAQYLAGYFFLWSYHLPPLAATPLTIVRYAHFYGERPSVRRRLLICSCVGAVAIGGAAAAAFRRQPRSLHGDARYATRREIAAAGLLRYDGFILGEYGGRYLMLGGQQGVALAAPPRSGKGVSFVIPNLLNWPDSAVVTDIKLENWTITAGFRKARGQEVHLFAPLAEDGRTARWNPLSYVSETAETRINGVQRIADMFYSETPGIDPFWIASARSLFVGIALYLFETPRLPKTIGEILRQGMASDDEGFSAHWKRIVQGRQAGRYPLSAECVRALYDVIDLAPVTASSIRKTFTSRLDLWANPILDRATSGNDFDLRELRSKRMTIYVGVNPDDLHRLRPVLSLFFQQALGLQTHKLPEHDASLKYQVAIFLDEVASLGKIPILAEAISYLPGYGVRVALIFHTPAQLREVYGAYNAETMMKSLAARILFAPKDFPDAREISDELGTLTVKAKSVSKPRFAKFGGKSHERGGNITVSDQKRPLLLPQEVKELGMETELILYEGLRPIRAKKIRYFADRQFRPRLLPPPLQTFAPALSVAGRAESQTEDSTMDAHTVATHRANVVDIEKLESIMLEDFVANFDSVHLPKDRPPTDTELQLAADEFLATLRTA
jgi:type IV secretion system protein VirD4